MFIHHVVTALVFLVTFVWNIMKFLIVLLSLQVAVGKIFIRVIFFHLLTVFCLQLIAAMTTSELMINMPYFAYVTFSNNQMSFYGGGALLVALSL